MKKLFALALVAAVLAGCAPTKMCKPGGDFNRDMYECKHRARQMAQLGGVYDPFEDIAQQRNCLEMKGWRPCANQD